MTTKNRVRQGEGLFSYVVASGDMRFIGIVERDLILRQDVESGSVILGMIPGCGPDCYANLSEILLEYVMSCEDCRNASLTAEAAERFGRRLGQKLIDLRYQTREAAPGLKVLSESTAIVVNSLGAPFQVEKSEDKLAYYLDYCPLHASADKSGLNLWIALAHSAFVTVCETLLTLAPGWTLLAPMDRVSDAPLLEVVFVRSTA